MRESTTGRAGSNNDVVVTGPVWHCARVPLLFRLIKTDLAMLPVKRHEVGREFPICTVSFETRSKFARPPGLAPSLAALPGTARDEPTGVRVMRGKKA